MRNLLIVLLLAGVALWPFVMLRQRWAMNLWERFKLVIVVYVVVVIVAGVVALVFRWDEIYG